MLLVVFNLDGTLLSYMTHPETGCPGWQINPEMCMALRSVIDIGHMVAIVINQSGVALGTTTEANFEQHIRMLANMFGFEDVTIFDGHRELAPVAPDTLAVFVCYADERSRNEHYRQLAHRRKPSGAMLLEAMHVFNMIPNDTVYLGDEDDDAAAAKAAGVGFIRYP